MVLVPIHLYQDVMVALDGVTIVRSDGIFSTASPSPLPSALHPTSASWLNLVERWFGLITSQAIRRGSFVSVARLEQAITRFLANWNGHAQPFRWTKTADQIKRSIHNGALIYETRH